MEDDFFENFELVKHLAYRSAVGNREFRAIENISKFFEKLRSGDIVVCENKQSDDFLLSSKKDSTLIW